MIFAAMGVVCMVNEAAIGWREDCCEGVTWARRRAAPRNDPACQECKSQWDDRALVAAPMSASDHVTGRQACTLGGEVRNVSRLSERNFHEAKAVCKVALVMFDDGCSRLCWQ